MMICIFLVLQFIPVIANVHLVNGQGCLGVIKGNSNSENPPFEDKNSNPLPANPAVQAIIPTYKFSCDCVNITSWETYVEPGGMRYRNNRVYDITFQVWRPSLTVNNNGCYSLLGDNLFTSITFSEGGLVQLTPTPPLNTIITAQSGDVVGYYTNSRQDNDNGIQLERDTEYISNLIWYHDTGTTPLNFVNNECPFPVGTELDRSLRSSTNAAPMLKISTIPCIDIQLASTPTLSSSAPSPMSSTSLPSTIPYTFSSNIHSTAYSNASPPSQHNLMIVVGGSVGGLLGLFLAAITVILLIVMFVKYKSHNLSQKQSSVNVLEKRNDEGIHTRSTATSFITTTTNEAYMTVTQNIENEIKLDNGVSGDHLIMEVNAAYASTTTQNSNKKCVSDILSPDPLVHTNVAYKCRNIGTDASTTHSVSGDENLSGNENKENYTYDYIDV